MIAWCGLSLLLKYKRVAQSSDVSRQFQRAHSMFLAVAMIATSLPMAIYYLIQYDRTHTTKFDFKTAEQDSLTVNVAFSVGIPLFALFITATVLVFKAAQQYTTDGFHTHDEEDSGEDSEDDEDIPSPTEAPFGSSAWSSSVQYRNARP